MQHPSSQDNAQPGCMERYLPVAAGGIAAAQNGSTGNANALAAGSQSLSSIGVKGSLRADTCNIVHRVNQVGCLDSGIPCSRHVLGQPRKLQVTMPHTKASNGLYQQQHPGDFLRTMVTILVSSSSAKNHITMCACCARHYTRMTSSPSLCQGPESLVCLSLHNVALWA